MTSAELDFRAVFSALRFNEPDTSALRRIPDSRWPALLALTDHAQLTLALGVRAIADLPASVQTRIATDLQNNALRHRALVATHARVERTLSEAGIPYQVLKGLTNWPWHTDRPEHRPQCDIDLLVPPEAAETAAELLRDDGWTAVERTHTATADHLPAMIRQTGWTWKGDYFDPEMPHALEIHFRLWNPAAECIAVEGIDSFPDRAAVRRLCGLSLPALNPVDGFTYACLHLVRHLLRGALMPRHVYEIAHFLERSAREDEFWSDWRQAAPDAPARRRLCAIAFRLARDWFGCDLHMVPSAAIAELPSPVALWFEMFAWSPALALITPNKDEVWLHMTLVDSRADALRIALRRIVPTRPAGVILDPHVPSCSVGLGLRFRRLAFSAGFAARRMLYHVRAAVPMLQAGVRFWRMKAKPT